MNVSIYNKGTNDENIIYLSFEVENMDVITDYYGHTSGMLYTSGNARVFPDNTIEIDFEDSHVYIIGNNGEEITDFEDWDYCQNEIIIEKIKAEILGGI
jgi:hypothetical protein